MEAGVSVLADHEGVARSKLLSAMVVRDWAAVEQVAPEWNTLLRKSAADTIFLTWEWMRAWIDVAGRDFEPLIVIVRNSQGVLVAIAPFYVVPYRFLGIFKFRVLRIAGDWPTGGEYPDLIVDPEVEQPALCCIADALMKHCRLWDCIWMSKIAGWTGATARLAQCAHHARIHIHQREMSFGYLQLPGTIKEFEAGLSGNRRQQMRRKKRQFLANDDFAFERCADVESLERYLRGLFDLHERRWNTQGQSGVFTRKPKEAHFYRRFAPVALRAGWLRVYAARQGDDLKAVQLGYVYNNTFLQIQEGFDPLYEAGVGNVLRHYAVEACINEKLSAYDFLGDMTEHKSRWLAQRRTGYEIFMGHRSLKNMVLFARTIWPAGRFLRPVQSGGGVAVAHSSEHGAEVAHGV